MSDASVDRAVSPRLDVKIVFPDDDTIRFESERLCAEPDGLLCRRFVGRAFLAPEIDRAVIDPATAEGVTPAIELRFDATQYSPRQILERVAALLDTPSGDPGVEVPSALTENGAPVYMVSNPWSYQPRASIVAGPCVSHGLPGPNGSS